MSDKGMHLRVQWPMPFADDSEFEEFIEHYFNAKEQTDSFQLFGRKGQKTDQDQLLGIRHKFELI